MALTNLQTQLKLNSRMKESQSEAFLMSDALVNELLADVVQHVGECK